MSPGFGELQGGRWLLALALPGVTVLKLRVENLLIEWGEVHGSLRVQETEKFQLVHVQVANGLHQGQLGNHLQGEKELVTAGMLGVVPLFTLHWGQTGGLGTPGFPAGVPCTAVPHSLGTGLGITGFAWPWGTSRLPTFGQPGSNLASPPSPHLSTGKGAPLHPNSIQVKAFPKCLILPKKTPTSWCTARFSSTVLALPAPQQRSTDRGRRNSPLTGLRSCSPNCPCVAHEL